MSCEILETERFFLKCPESDDQDRDSKSVTKSVFLKDTDELVGGVSLVNIDRTNSSAELVFWTAEEHWNKGYATECAREMVDFGFELLGLERIYGKCVTDNEAGAIVMEKAGMIHEGTMRHEILKNGEFKDLHHYSILRSEWEEITNPGPLIIFETERLILRPLVWDDAEDLYSSRNHPAYENFPSHIPYPFPLDKAKRYVRRAMQKRKDRSGFFFAVMLKETGEFVGEVHIWWIYWKELYGEIGYSFDPKFWGGGYATEASKELLRYAFEDLGLRKIMAITMTDNAQSIRVIEKLGMTFEGRERESWLIGDKFPDFDHFSILKREWEEMK